MSQHITRLKQEDLSDLKALLESIGEHGASAHSKIADLLFEKYLAEADINMKRIFVAEIFCKLVQSIEDYGAMCLAWEADPQVYPLRAMLNVKTRHVLSFFSAAKDGLGRERIMRIWAIPEGSELEKKGHLKGEDSALYAKFVSIFIDEIDRNLKQIGTMLDSGGSKEKPVRYGDIVNMYFNAKHGVKIFFPTKSAGHLELLEDYLSIVIGPGNAVAPDTGHVEEALQIGRFKLAEDSVRRLVENVRATCDKTGLLARMRRSWLDSDEFILPYFAAAREHLKGPKLEGRPAEGGSI